MKYKVLILTIFGLLDLNLCASFDLAKESFKAYEYSYPELSKFFNRYQCPRDIEIKILGKGIPKYIKNDVLKYGNYYVKTNFERIINAKRIENYIKSKNFKHIGVAKKYLNQHLLVVAPEIDSKGLADNKVIETVTENINKEIVTPGLLKVRELTMSYARSKNYLNADSSHISYKADVGHSVACNETELEFYDLARDTLYADFHPDNFVFDGKSKKWILIDTETRSFQGVGISKKIDDLEIKKYDDPDINFTKVCNEYHKFVNRRIWDRYLRRASNSLFLE